MSASIRERPHTPPDATDAYQEYLRRRRQTVQTEPDIRPVFTDRETRALLELIEITKDNFPPNSKTLLEGISVKLGKARAEALDATS